MKTDEQGTVTLAPNEEVAAAQRDMLVGFNHTVHDAAVEALDDMPGRKTKKFVGWLSEGTLTITDGEVVTVEGSESEPEPETEPDEAGESEGEQADDDSDGNDEGDSESTEDRTPEPAHA